MCSYTEDTIKYTDNFGKDDNKTRQASLGDVDKSNILIIGHYMDHFFIDEEINVSELWVKNYNERKACEKF